MASGDASRARNPQGPNSSEYKAVRDHYGPLINKLQHVLVQMANEFFSKELISYHEKGDAVSSRQPPYNTATAIMGSIMTKIEHNTDWYYTFIEVLQISDLKEVGEDIESHRTQSVQEDSYTPLIRENNFTATTRGSQQHKDNCHDTESDKKFQSTAASGDDDSAYSESQTDFTNKGDEVQREEDELAQEEIQPPVQNSSNTSMHPCIPQQPMDTSEPSQIDLEVGATFTAYPRRSQTNGNKELEKAIRDKKTLEAELECQTIRHSGELEEKTREIDALKETVKEKDHTIEKLESEITKLKSDKNEMMETENVKTTEQTHSEADYQVKITSLNEKIASLITKLEVAEREKTEALEKVETLNEQLKNKDYEMNLSIAVMSKNMAELKLEKEKEINVYKVMSKNQEILAEKNEKDKIKAELKVKDIENENLQRKLEELQKQIPK